MKTIFCAFGLLLVAAAQAQDVYPSRPVYIIVPSAPGGGADTVARLLTEVARAEKYQAGVAIAAFVP
jgi:tripartite-type tricarboxylate transporter receptor subunit TctC